MAMTLTIQDVIRWIKEDTEAKEELRRILLTEELLNLPQRLDRLIELVEQNSRDIAKLYELAEQNTQLAEQKSREIIKLVGEIGNLVKVVEQQGQHIGVLRGLVLEAALQGRAISLLSGRLKLRRGRVMRGPVMLEINHQFEDAVDAATESGVITEEQNRRIFNTDLIARAIDSATGDVVYVAAEASFTIEPQDIQRANESARALSLVFPSNDVKTAVFGTAVSIQDSDWAKRQDVEVFTLELPR